MTPHDQHTERILLCVLAAETVRAETLKMEQRRPGVNAAPVSTLDGPSRGRTFCDHRYLSPELTRGLTGQRRLLNELRNCVTCCATH